jgi:hypothetical protein
MDSARGFRPANDHALDAPLSVVVRGDEVLVLGARGAVQALSVRAAETSVTRLLDAIAIAQGRMPSLRR